MLKPEEVTKVTIYGPDSEMESIISTLHKLKILHIVDHQPGELDIGTPLAQAEQLSETLLSIQAITSHLQPYADPKQKKEQAIQLGSTKQFERELKKLNNEVLTNTSKLKELNTTQKKMQGQLTKVEDLHNLHLDLGIFTEYETLSYFLGHVHKEEGLQEGIKKITPQYELTTSKQNKQTILALFVQKEHEEKIGELLTKHNYQGMETDFLSTLKGDTKHNITAFKKSLRHNKQEQETITKTLHELSKEWLGKLAQHKQALERELEQQQAPLKFAKTQDAFIIKGWIPSKEYEANIKKLTQEVNNKIYIAKGDIENRDDVPIKLKHNKAMSPFKFFLDLYTLPNYKEFDPTLFLFLGFPFFFGMIVGDIGYGITILAMSYLFKKKMPQFKQFFTIFIWSALSSIIWGVLFGEFYGEEILFGVELPHILSRAHEIHTLLYMSLGIGVFHIVLGLILGFITIKKAHGLAHAITEKGGWLILLTSAGTLSASYMNILQWPVGISYGIMAIAIVIIYRGEGINGMIELPGIFSNILSYARLMAVGVSSVLIAIVVNDFTKQFMSQGGIMIAVGILILIIGHSINLALAMLGGFLHSLRLHYVEFFTKFFVGGGKPFNAFGEDK